MMLLITATYVGQGLLIAELLSSVFSSIEIGDLVPPFATIGGLQLARIVLIVVRDSWAPRVSARVKEAVRERMTLKLMEIGPGQAQRMRTGDLQSTLVDSVELLDPVLPPIDVWPALWSATIDYGRSAHSITFRQPPASCRPQILNTSEVEIEYLRRTGARSHLKLSRQQSEITSGSLSPIRNTSCNDPWDCVHVAPS